MSPWPTSPLSLPDEEVQVWSAGLSRPQDDLEAFAALLAVDERARAEKFIFERDRQRYIAGRGLLRVMLSRYLETEPSGLVFTYGPHRKPALVPAEAGRRLDFNLAHSEDLALFAFCWNRRIGIDLEHVRPMPDEDDFARRFFSANETARLAALRGRDKTDEFFRIWTCKEAILKAIGTGLARPLDQTEVSAEESGSVRIVTVDGSREESSRWALMTYEPTPGFRASLCGEQPDWKPVFRQLPV